MRMKLRLLAAALLLPACGGGGGGGWHSAFPPLPTSGSGGTTGGGWLAPLALVDTSAPDHVIDASQADLDITQDLQAALTAGGIITFINGPRTVLLTATLVQPAFESAVIDGGGAITLSGSDVRQILRKDYQSVLTVQGLTFRDARSAQSGAAIEVINWDGALTVIQCDFVDCRATDPGPDRGGGAIRATGQTAFRVSECTFTDCAGSNGGALNSLGCPFTIIDCVFENNRAHGTGGGADVGSSGGGGIGGAVYIDGVSQMAPSPAERSLRVSGSVFRNNIANDHAGGIFGYTVPGTNSAVTIDGCTFSGNEVSGISAAGENAGALYNQHGSLTIRNTTFDRNVVTGGGGAIFVVIPQAPALFESCTFHANAAGMGGALWLGTGTYTLQNCTISENTAVQWGAGIFGASNVTARNTIFSENVGGDTNANVNGWHVNQALAGGSNNIQFPSTKGGGPADVAVAGSVSNADPNLGALAPNGTLTGSPTQSIPAAGNAENAGTATGAPATDQRGLPRVGAVDIGAFERQ